MSKGPSTLEREAALALVELEGRDAEIEHDAVDRMYADRRECLTHFAERGMQDREVGFRGGQHLRACHCVRIAIDSDHPAARSIEHRPAVATAAEGRVDVNASVPQPQCVQSLVEKNGPMGHSAFPQARYQQAAAGVRPENRHTASGLAFLPNPHERRCLVSFHRASRLESSTARLNAIEIHPSAGTPPLGQE